MSKLNMSKQSGMKPRDGSTDQSIYLSVWLSVCMYVCLSVCLSVHIQAVEESVSMMEEGMGERIYGGHILIAGGTVSKSPGCTSCMNPQHWIDG